MKKLIVLLLTILSVASFAKSDFGEEGAMEAGGSISLNSIDIEGADRNYEVEIEPRFAYYLMDQFFLAGRLHFNSEERGSFFGIGVTGGYLFTLDYPVAPYIEGGLEVIHSTWGESRLGIAIPVEGGIKIPIFDHVSVDVGAAIYIKAIEEGSGTDVGLHSAVSFWIF